MIIRQICRKRLRDAINIAYFAYLVNYFIAYFAFIFLKNYVNSKKQGEQEQFQQWE